jgi:hypothetical protein
MEDKEEARKIREEDKKENQIFQKNMTDGLKKNNDSINEIKAKQDRMEKKIEEISAKQDKMEKDINNIVEKNNLKR